MPKQNHYRYIVVSRKTRLEELVERFNTWPQAKFYLEHNDTDAQDYLNEHDQYKKQLAEVERFLKPRGRFQLLERSLLPSYQFSSNDIVIVVGQDGLVANTLKYLNGQPVVAINPDPMRWDGLLLPFKLNDLPKIIESVEKQNMSIKYVTFAEGKTNDGQSLLAVNDLFIGPKSHTSARYQLRWQNHVETQSSSGIIVSTGLGSTGWFQSILAGAMGVTGQNQHSLKNGFAWDTQHLQYAVREPFPSQTTGTTLVFGEITKKNQLVVESYMPENGVIFSDGLEHDYLSFNAGCVLTISIADHQGILVY